MANNTSGTKVIVVGAGIAGPVLATFLKLKGYSPIVYERTSTLSDAGVGHCMQPNGLQVLAKIPGLLENLEGASVRKIGFYSVLPEDKGVLAAHDIPANAPLLGVRRSILIKTLVETAQQHGVEFKFGHKLVGLEQAGDSVTVTFENGEKDTASIVVGCDGLHSNTRICLFGAEKADFTGLVQIAGITPTPDVLRDGLANVFGNGCSVVTYPVNATRSCWAATRREPEAKETWRATDSSAAETIKASPLAEWEFGIGEAIKNSDFIVKYGLYDRPELKSWHKGRVVLIGDAAHPTSPHLGQGANQAFEDIELLTQLLEEHNASTTLLSTETLEALLSKFESVRIPRTTELVKGARAQGETRVAQGVDAYGKRDGHAHVY